MRPTMKTKKTMDLERVAKWVGNKQGRIERSNLKGTRRMDEEGEEMNSLFEGMDPPLLLLRISTILLSLALFKTLLFSFLFSVLFLILFFF